MKNHLHNGLVVFFILSMGCLVFLAGCVTVPGQKESYVDLVYPGDQKAETTWPDKDLREKFRRYWTYRFMDGKKNELFQMEAPYVQEMVNPKKYNSYIRGNWRSDLIEIRIREVKPISEVLFTVESEIWARLPDQNLHSVFISGQWVKVQGGWYHVLKDPIFFPEL